VEVKSPRVVIPVWIATLLWIGSSLAVGTSFRRFFVVLLMWMSAISFRSLDYAEEEYTDHGEYGLVFWSISLIWSVGIFAARLPVWSSMLFGFLSAFPIASRHRPSVAERIHCTNSLSHTKLAFNSIVLWLPILLTVVLYQTVGKFLGRIIRMGVVNPIFGYPARAFSRYISGTGVDIPYSVFFEKSLSAGGVDILWFRIASLNMILIVIESMFFVLAGGVLCSSLFYLYDRFNDKSIRSKGFQR
jgi:hypothetical protein